MYQEKLDDAQIELQARVEQGIRLEKALEVSQAEVKRLRRRVKELEDDKNHDEDSDSMADENIIDGDDVAEEGEDGDALRRQLLAQRQQRSERKKQQRRSESERKNATRGETDADSSSNDGETSSALRVNTSRSRRGGKHSGRSSSGWDDSGDDDARETESDTSLRPQGYFTPMSSASKQQGMSPRWSPRVDFTRSPSSARLASATKNLADSLSRLKPVSSDSVGGGAGEAPRNHTEFTRYQKEQALLIENLEAKLVAMTTFVTTFKTATAVKRAAAKFKEGPENAAAAQAKENGDATARAGEAARGGGGGFENEEKQYEPSESNGSDAGNGREETKDSELSAAGSPKSDSVDMSIGSGREDEASDGSAAANSPNAQLEQQETDSDGGRDNDSDDDDDDDQDEEEMIVDGVKDESGKPLSPIANARVVEVQ